MKFRHAAICWVFWTFVCGNVIGNSTEAPMEVRDLVERADPRANVEYCGAVATGTIDYYLFLLEHQELAGLVLVKQRAGMIPVIVDVDTSLFPFPDDAEHSVEKPVQDAIESLLQRRSFVKKSRVLRRTSRQDPEVSAVGREIDRVIYPITGFKLGSNSTREILRLLRTGPTVEVDPGTAPPGSIIVSPTQASPNGPVYLGHAGIVGTNGSIYSADARYGGKRSKNFSLTSWRKEFSGTNGSYAFVLHAPSIHSAQGLK
jgi:hypothetical protein